MRRVALLLVCVGWFFASATPSEAAFVSGFVGNSGLSTNPNAGGWINFAVYDNSGGGNWLTDLGVGGVLSTVTGASTFTGSEKTVFFYQVVRNSVAQGGPVTRLLNLEIFGASEKFTKIGALTGTVFNELGVGAVGPLTNPTLGTVAMPGVIESNGQLNVTPLTSAFVPNAGAKNVIDMNLDPLDPLLGQFTWASGGTGMAANEYSSVVFMTSNSDINWLQWRPGQTFISGGGPSALVPVTTPEPGSLVLLGLAMVVGGVGYGWKRRKQQAAQE